MMSAYYHPDNETVNAVYAMTARERYQHSQAMLFASAIDRWYWMHDIQEGPSEEDIEWLCMVLDLVDPWPPVEAGDADYLEWLREESSHVPT